MKEYLLLFRNESLPGGYITTAQDMAEDMPAWQHWIGQIALQGQLVSTQPVDYTGLVLSREGYSHGPVKDTDSEVVAGFLICRAESLESLRPWAEQCPILKYPKGRVEIRPLHPFAI